MDRCGATPTGAALIAEGCSALDIVQEPEAFTSALEADLDDVALRFRDRRDLAPALRELDATRPLLESLAEEARRGDLCESRGIAATAHRNVGSTRQIVLKAKEAYFDGMPEQTRIAEEADADESDIKLLMFEVIAAELDRLGNHLEAVGRTLATACSQITSKGNVRGRITKIDDRLRRVEIGGVVTAMGNSFKATTPLSEGQLVDVSGQAFKDGTSVANDVGVIADLPDSAPGITSKKCLFLRFAPVQYAWASYNGPFTLQRLEGYFSNNGYLPEQGMGVAVVGEGCDSPEHRDDPYIRQSVKISLDYKAKNGSMVANYSMATDLDEKDGPVWFPSAWPGYPADMTVTWYLQSCLAGTCGKKIQFDQEKLPMAIYKRWEFCVAEPHPGKVVLEDKDQVNFQPVQIRYLGGLGFDMSEEPEVTFEAEAYKVLSSNTSTYPNTSVIQTKCSVSAECAPVPFAIYNQDFVSFPALNFSKFVLGKAKAGVAGPVGLKWPRMLGKRNGHTFSYSCSMTPGIVVRDIVNKANPALFTEFRYPFYPGSPTWTMGQGNNGSLTHNGPYKYAFDFVAGEGTEIRAARKGVVRFVREDQTGNMYNWATLFGKKLATTICTSLKCLENVLIIRHQDGFEAAYLHMQTNGVTPQVGDIVLRGDPVAFVGNTGYSTNSHLHWHSQNSNGITLESCFEDLVFPCFKPIKGLPLASTNNK